MRWIKTRFGNDALRPWIPRAHSVANAQAAPIQALEASGLELSHLSRYLFVILLVTGCALFSTWSRIDLVETAVALDRTERNYRKAQAEHARLVLELATLNDPIRLEQFSEDLQLDPTVTMVDIAPVAALP